MTVERESPRPASRREAVKIEPWMRWVCSALGLVGLTAGGVAVYVRDVEVGPGVLLALGAIFLLIGVSGRMPTRLKVGENEAEWVNEVSDVIQDAVTSAPREQQQEVVRRLERSDAPPVILEPIREAVSWEAAMAGDIERAIQITAGLEREEVDDVVRYWDLLARRTSDDGLIAFIIKWLPENQSRRDISWSIDQIVRYTEQHFAQPEFIGVVVILNQPTISVDYSKLIAREHPDLFNRFLFPAFRNPLSQFSQLQIAIDGLMDLPKYDKNEFMHRR